MQYHGFYQGRELVGGVGTWDDWIAGSREAVSGSVRDRWREHLDHGQPEFILPISPQIKLDFPFRATRLSSVHLDQIVGLTRYTAGARPNLMLARAHSGKGGLAGVKLKKLKQQLRYMENARARVLPIASLTPDELADAYTELHLLRWDGTRPRGHSYLGDLFREWRDLLFGNFVSLDGRIIAVDISYKVTSQRYLYVESVNGAWDPAYHNLSPGSVIMYVNTRDAWARAKDLNLQARYSFGYAADEKGYKHMWCDPHRLYQTSQLRKSFPRRMAGVSGRLLRTLTSR